MAVSTRKLIELAFLALLDSGIDYRTRNVGCFMSGIAYHLLEVADAVRILFEVFLDCSLTESHGAGRV